MSHGSLLSSGLCNPGYLLLYVFLSVCDSSAQQDAVARKLKLEAKQQQQCKGAIKKPPPPPPVVQVPVDPEPKNSSNTTSKLVNQIAILKDQNKCLEGKVQVSFPRKLSLPGALISIFFIAGLLRSRKKESR